MKNNCILAIDQSTSGTKAILFDENSMVKHRVTIEHRQYYPRPGWVEHDPMEILANSRKAMELVIEESSAAASDIAALAITNQRETVVAWDGETGKPVYNAFVWQDQRATEFCESLKEAEKGPIIRSKTGLLIDTYFSAGKLAWLVKNRPEVAQAAREGRVLCGTIDSWLIWNFTGGKVHATDYSNACRTMLFNIHTLAFDEELKEIFLVPDFIFPEPRPSNSRFGETALPGTSRSVPISGVAGDSHAALFGQCCFRSGTAKTTYGTGSSIMMNIGGKPLDPPEGIVLSIGWGFDAEVTYVFEGNIHSTGDTIRWMADEVGLFSDMEEAEKAAASLETNGGVYLVPAFAGLGAPYWEHGLSALITGLSRAAGRSHIVRAGLESIAYQVYDVVERMTGASQVSMVDLRVDGGPTRNRFLMQFQADILESPIRVSSIEEVSALGAAYLGGVREGLWADRATLTGLWREQKKYTPSMAEESRMKNLHGWKRAVAQTIAGKQTGP